MKLIMLRHAARSPHDVGDSGLNAYGRAQAFQLPQSLNPQGPLPPPSLMISSPKKRTRETLLPLAARLGLTLSIDKGLDERRQNETAREFQERVHSVLEGLTRNLSVTPALRETCILMCSHLDWLEAAIAVLPSDLADAEHLNWSNCEFRIFKWQGGIWCLAGHGVINCADWAGD